MATDVLERGKVDRSMSPLDEIKERALRLNADLGARLIKEAIKDPTVLASIEDGVTLIHAIEGEPEVTAYNYFLGHKARERGEEVRVIHWVKTKRGNGSLPV